jgi:hypothetical protein
VLLRICRWLVVVWRHPLLARSFLVISFSFSFSCFVIMSVYFYWCLSKTPLSRTRCQYRVSARSGLRTRGYIRCRFLIHAGKLGVSIRLTLPLPTQQAPTYHHTTIPYHQLRLAQHLNRPLLCLYWFILFIMTTTSPRRSPLRLRRRRQMQT